MTVHVWNPTYALMSFCIKWNTNMDNITAVTLLHPSCNTLHVAKTNVHNYRKENLREQKKHNVLRQLAQKAIAKRLEAQDCKSKKQKRAKGENHF